MATSYRAAAVQMHADEDKAANLVTATRLVEQAAEQGARLVVLPELFNCLGRFETIVANAEPIPGPTSEALSELAARLSIVLVAGSIAEKCGDGEKTYNTSLVFASGGELIATYRKIHLFDIALDDGPSNTESRWIKAGSEISIASTELGVIGNSICYDLRFGEVYRALAARGAEMLLVPAAFTKTTGEAHWHTLLRARAIENQVYVIAPNQFGMHTMGIETYGHSLIIDPWGTILAEGGENEEIITAEIDPARIADIRRQMPTDEHRQPWLQSKEV